MEAKYRRNSHGGRERAKHFLKVRVTRWVDGWWHRSSRGRGVGITATRKGGGNGGKRRQKRIEEEVDSVGERGHRQREYERERGGTG